MCGVGPDYTHSSLLYVPLSLSQYIWSKAPPPKKKKKKESKKIVVRGDEVRKVESVQLKVIQYLTTGNNMEIGNYNSILVKVLVLLVNNFWLLLSMWLLT